MAPLMVFTLSAMAWSIWRHGTLKNSIPIATATAAATSRTVWLAPSRASEPNSLMTSTCSATSTASGTSAIAQ